MVSEAEVQEIVRDVAARTGQRVPRLSFTPGRISFMPVMVVNGSVVVTPAARTALSTEAIRFAVAQGMVADKLGDRGLGLRRTAILFLAIVAGYAASRPFHGPARLLVDLLVAGVVLAALLFASASIRSKWPSLENERRLLAVIPSLDGAREYKQTTDLLNLNRDVPESWDGPHGELVNLERLGKVAREIGLS